MNSQQVDIKVFIPNTRIKYKFLHVSIPLYDLSCNCLGDRAQRISEGFSDPPNLIRQCEK